MKFMKSVCPSELRELYCASDLFVLPSRHESFGNVVAEALACGVPCLISPRVGIDFPENLQEMAVKVVPREVEAWSQAIERFIEMGRPSDELRRVASSWSHKAYSLDTIARRMENCYEQVIDSTSRKS